MVRNIHCTNQTSFFNELELFNPTSVAAKAQEALLADLARPQTLPESANRRYIGISAVSANAWHVGFRLIESALILRRRQPPIELVGEAWNHTEPANDGTEGPKSEKCELLPIR